MSIMKSDAVYLSKRGLTIFIDCHDDHFLINAQFIGRVLQCGSILLDRCRDHPLVRAHLFASNHPSTHPPSPTRSPTHSPTHSTRVGAVWGL